MEDKRWHPRNKSSSSRSDRRNQRQTHHADGRRPRAENAVRRLPGTRESSVDSIGADTNRESEIGLRKGGSRTTPRDRSAYSAPPTPENSSVDDDDDDDDGADVTAQHFPTATRLRTSSVVDPYLGDSLSSVAPNPYSLSSRNRGNAIRRTSSTATFSEEELNVKYRKVEASSPPSRAVTDSRDVEKAAGANAGASHGATRKSRSEYSSPRSLPISNVKRPYSEAGTRQHERAQLASRFQDVDPEVGRPSRKPTKATQTEAVLEEGHRSPKGRPSREERGPSALENYSVRSGHETPEREEPYGGRSSRPLSSASDHAGRPRAFPAERRGGAHDVPVFSEAVSHTKLPRFLRSTCDIPDLVPDGEDERHSAINCESDAVFPSARPTAYSGSTQAPDRSPPSSDIYEPRRVEPSREPSQHAIPSSARSSVVQSVQAYELGSGKSSQTKPKRDGRRSVSTSRTLSPSPESSLKSRDGSKMEMGRQKRVSPKALPPEESSSLTGRTEDLATVTVAGSSDIEAATDGTSSVTAVRRTHNKAVQVSIAQPDKTVIACTVLSGVLTVALVAVILFGVLSR